MNDVVGIQFLSDSIPENKKINTWYITFFCAVPENSLRIHHCDVSENYQWIHKFFQKGLRKFIRAGWNDTCMYRIFRTEWFHPVIRTAETGNIETPSAWCRNPQSFSDRLISIRNRASGWKSAPIRKVKITSPRFPLFFSFFRGFFRFFRVSFSSDCFPDSLPAHIRFSRNAFQWRHTGFSACFFNTFCLNCFRRIRCSFMNFPIIPVSGSAGSGGAPLRGRSYSPPIPSVSHDFGREDTESRTAPHTGAVTSMPDFPEPGRTAEGSACGHGRNRDFLPVRSGLLSHLRLTRKQYVHFFLRSFPIPNHKHNY